MEFLAKDVAKLVLGYLREEKCQDAFQEFLNSSKNLQESSDRYKRGKPIVTRVFGLSLMDFLREYALIYTIVSEHIELTDYYSNNSSCSKRPTLVQQLLYLLGNDEVDSRVNSPERDSSLHISHTPQNLPSSSILVDTVEVGVDAIVNNEFVSPDKCNLSKEKFERMFVENKSFASMLADTINKTVSISLSPEANTLNIPHPTVKKIAKHTVKEDPLINQLIDELFKSDATEREILTDCNDSASEIEATSNMPFLTMQPNESNDIIQETDKNKPPHVGNTNVTEPKDGVTELCTAIAGITDQNMQASVTGGLLMVQAEVTSLVDQNEVANSLCVIDTQSYIGLPQINTIFTEQDILTMPTIFVCESNKAVEPLAPAPVYKSSKTKKTGLKKIAPKVPKTLSEYLTQYNCDEPSPIKEIIENPKHISTKPRPSKKESFKKGSTKPIAINSAPPMSLPSLETPQVKPENKETRSRTTPHGGGSHVRQLDFSTPEKTDLLDIALFKNKAAETKGSNEKETKGGNVLPATVVPEDLRLAKDKQAKPNKKTKIAEAANPIPSTSWDANLRLIAHLPDEEQNSKAKRKRSYDSSDATNPPKKPKEAAASNSTEENVIIPEPVLIISPESVDESDLVQENTEPEEKKASILRPRYHKKCNTDGNDEKNSSPEQIVLDSIAKVTSCEIINDAKNLVILSPSKMNVNKRNIINPEQTKDEQRHVTFENPQQMDVPKRISLFETPVKNDFAINPKTPGLLNTPFTNAVIDQLNQVDLTAFPTPKFPITPNFALSPDVENEQSSIGKMQGGTSKHSTTSSYYLPSDSEQSKSLEQLVEESKSSEIPKISANDKLKEFNQSMIGRKNLHLLKMTTEIIEEESSDNVSYSISSDSESSSSDDSGHQQTSNETNAEQQRYPLRSRTANKRNSSESEPVRKTLKVSKKIILQEMDAKRQRTIERLKNDSGKMPTLKTKRTTVQNKKSAPKKQASSVTQGSATVNSNKEVVLHLFSDDSIPEPMQIVEANLEKSSSNTPVLEQDKESREAGADKKSEDHDADSLVKGLKKWGIHLIPNKKNSTPVIGEAKQEFSMDKSAKTPNQDKTSENSVQSTKRRPPINIIQQHTIKSSNKSKINQSNKTVSNELEQSAIEEKLKQFETDAVQLQESPVDTQSILKQIPKEPCVKLISPIDKVKSPIKKSVPKEKCSPEIELLLEAKRKDLHMELIKHPLIILDETLEDGEIKTDDEGSPDRIKHSSSRSRHDNSSSRRRTSRDFRRRNDSKSKSKVSPKREKSKRRSPKIDPKITDKSKERMKPDEIRDRSRRSPNREVKASDKLRKSPKARDRTRRSPTTRDKSKISQKVDKPKDIRKVSQVVTDKFSVTNSTETLRIKYDENKRCRRTLADYDLKILERIISAGIYITELDKVEFKRMSFIPTKILLDIPTKQEAYTSSLVAPLNSEKSHKTLENLYPEQASKYKTSSEDILHKIAERRYSDKLKESKSKESKSRKSDESRRNKSPGKSKAAEVLSVQSEKNKQDVGSSKSKKIKDNETSDESRHNKSPGKSKAAEVLSVQSEKNKQDVRSSKSQKIKDNETSRTIIEDNEQIASSNKIKNDEIKSNKNPIETMAVERGSLNLSLKLAEEPSTSPNGINDDLMNYAIVGSVREPNPEDSELDASLRKLSKSKDDHNNIQPEDSVACAELLRSIDVDSFLKKLHGET